MVVEREATRSWDDPALDGHQPDRKYQDDFTEHHSAVPLNEKCQKTDNGKNRLDLIPPHALDEVGWAFTEGVKKHGAKNYKYGTDWGVYIGSTLRHINKWHRGEKNDPDGGRHHLAKAIANLMILYEFERTGVGVDDRPPGKTVYGTGRTMAEIEAAADKLMAGAAGRDYVHPTMETDERMK